MGPQVQTDARPLVLSIYDGFEWRGRSGVVRGLAAQARAARLAHQEALAANVPVFALGRGPLCRSPAGLRGTGRFDLSLMPFFLHRCGRRLRAERSKSVFDQFWAARETYRPREYVCECLTMERPTEAYPISYARTGRNREMANE